jgi:hypothetical protein
MRPLGILGVILITAGAVILIMRGLSYTKGRESVQVGPIGLSVEKKGFIPPIVGVLVLAVGAVMVVSARRRP